MTKSWRASFGLTIHLAACTKVLTPIFLNQTFLYHWILFGISHLPYSNAIFIHRSEFEIKRPVPLCNNDKMVCTSILKISSENYIEEGPFCSCKGCQSNWEADDNQSLTWYHHERVDWLVHFRFCEAVLARRECKNEELSDVIAVMWASGSEDWHPHLESIRCHCRDHRFYMRGWMLRDDNIWTYEFSCERPLCKKEEPCMRHYMDSSNSHTVGYHFLCSCPEGFHCPSKKAAETFRAYQLNDHDEFGPFMLGFCQPLLGWHQVAKPVS